MGYLILQFDTETGDITGSVKVSQLPEKPLAANQMVTEQTELDPDKFKIQNGSIVPKDAPELVAETV